MEDESDKKSRILRATLELITEHGFHATPVSLIAAEAQVGAGTIYRYFANKEAIINELYDRIETELHEATMAGLPAEPSVRDEFYLKWRNILRYFLDHPQEAGFIEQFSASPFINPRLAEETKRRNAHLQILRERGISTAQIRPVLYRTLAVYLWGTVKQLHHLQTAEPGSVTEELIAEIFETFWKGIRAD